MFEWPVAQKRQWPQTGRKEVTTWSPSLTRETPGPTFSMMPGALVAADDREARDDVAVAQVLVGVAQARGHPADQYLPLLGLVEIELGDLPIATGLPQHGCPGLHEAPPSCDADGAIVPPLSFPARCTARGSAVGGGGLREAGVGRLRASRRGRRIAECQSSSAGGSTSWYWSSCLHARVAAGDLERVVQPRGADLRLLRALARRSGSRTRSGRASILRLSGVRSALRLASLSSALVRRESAPIGTSSGLPAATCGAAVNW